MTRYFKVALAAPMTRYFKVALAAPMIAYRVAAVALPAARRAVLGELLYCLDHLEGGR